MTMTVNTPLASRAHDGVVADNDPAARPRRRSFSPEYKLAILEAYDRPAEPGAKDPCCAGRACTPPTSSSGAGPATPAPSTPWPPSAAAQAQRQGGRAGPAPPPERAPRRRARSHQGGPGHLLDDGAYLASMSHLPPSRGATAKLSTMYRLLRASGESRDRRRQRGHPARTKPQLLATKPNGRLAAVAESERLPTPNLSEIVIPTVALDESESVEPLRGLSAALALLACSRLVALGVPGHPTAMLDLTTTLARRVPIYRIRDSVADRGGAAGPGWNRSPPHLGTPLETAV